MRRRLFLITLLFAALTLTGVSVSSAVSGPAQFTPNPVDLGSVQVGDSPASQTVTVTNSGDTDMTVDASAFSFTGANPGAFGIANDGCSGTTVTAGTSCQVDVTFAPGSAGSFSATLNMASDSATSPDQVGVSGTGTPAPAPGISVTPVSPFDFGNHKVGDAPADSQQFTIANNGTGSLTSVSVTVTGGGFSPGNDNCPATLAAGDSCSATALFLPGSAGPTTGSLTVSSSELPPFIVELDGTGTVPVASVPNAVSFETPLNVAQVQSVTLTNTGNAVLNVVGARVTGDAAFSGTGNGNCGNAHLAPGGSCNAQVQFDPSAGGIFNGSVTFTDDDNSVANSTQSVPLTGTIDVPGISAAPTSVPFGDLVAGHLSGTQTVTVTNTGKANLRIDAVNINGLAPGSFVLGAETCTDGLIAPNGTCTANVRFAPAKAANRVANLVFVNNAGPDQNVALTGQGLAPADASSVRAAAGCSDAFLTWQNPDMNFFKKVLVVRNSRRYPRNPSDGTKVRHTGPELLDTAPRQFHTYRYTLFARYGSYNGERHFYSTGVHAKIRTGRICTPRNNGLNGDLTPKLDWTAYNGARSYAFILQHGGKTIWVRYPKKTLFQFPTSWSYKGTTHALGHGSTYVLYLYAYTRTRPNGIIIGHTTWTEK
jgi:HYDIN/CFA65/VesB family protein